MTIEQTVEIPVSHRLTINVPREVPAGPVVLTFTPKPEVPAAADSNLLPSYSVEDAIQIAKQRRSDPNLKPLSHYFGILSPGTYGDGVAYQRKLRDEWDD
ncbi:hypothetical protein AGMMS50230_01440 [Spirochaetia bacterium]|nr:hypothetical protein AGMMS50230_01440 [Spirochaetia bacterium]